MASTACASMSLITRTVMPSVRRRISRRTSAAFYIDFLPSEPGSREVATSAEQVADHVTEMRLLASFQALLP
jgi:hypothetical protein